MRKLALLAVVALIGADILTWPRATEANPAPTRVVSTSPYDLHPNANVRHFPVLTIAELF
jgi:hypothetical protein